MNSSACMDLWAVVPEMILAGLALVLVPLAAFARGRWQNLPALAAMVGLLLSMGATAAMWDNPPAAAFCGTYAVDRFGTLYKLLVECAALISLLTLTSHFRGHPQQAHVPLPLLFATVGALGVVSSLDLGLILLFIQIMSIGSYLLVILVRANARAQEACLKYFIYGAAVLAVMGYGMSFLFGLAGSLELRAIGAALAVRDPVWIIVAFGLVFAGYAFEATLAPFQFWAPDVYQGASAPASGALSVLPKIAAFAALLRFLVEGMPHQEATWSVVVAVVAAATMTLGNLAALRQRELKRLLAYSSIAQAGYLLMGVAVVLRTATAAPAVVFYLAAYLLMNLGAFAIVAVLERDTGSDARTVFRGLAKRAPWMAATLTIALLSLAGIPPLAGFAGKVLLLTAAIDGHMTWLAVVAAINMAVGLYYYATVIADMYFAPSARRDPIPSGIGYCCAAALATLGTIGLGVMPHAVLAFANMASWLR
jgi:NADH-quinone oxidoreductase subunit N